MKIKVYKTAVFLLFSVLFFTAHSQDVPNVALKNLKGKTVQTSIFNQTDNKVYVISFWASWCIPCINELSIINDLEDSWKKDFNFEFYAISEDDSRTVKKVPSVVNGKAWNFEVLLDKNQDMQRHLGFSGVPYTVVVKNGKIVYRHPGYNEGDEKDLYQIIKSNQ